MYFVSWILLIFIPSLIQNSAQDVSILNAPLTGNPETRIIFIPRPAASAAGPAAQPMCPAMCCRRFCTGMGAVGSTPSCTGMSPTYMCMTYTTPAMPMPMPCIMRMMPMCMGCTLPAPCTPATMQCPAASMGAIAVAATPYITLCP